MVFTVIFLGRKDFEDKMVPIKEPLRTENIKDLKDGGSVNLRANHRGSSQGGQSLHLRGEEVLS